MNGLQRSRQLALNNKIILQMIDQENALTVEEFEAGKLMVPPESPCYEKYKRQNPNNSFDHCVVAACSSPL